MKIFISLPRFEAVTTRIGNSSAELHSETITSADQKYILHKQFHTANETLLLSFVEEVYDSLLATLHV
jgi:hypothetical protein